VLGRELWLPCNLLFGAIPDKEWPKMDHTTNLLDYLHDIYSYACQHLKMATDQMKTYYDKLANCMGYHEGDKAWPNPQTPNLMGEARTR
jgi:hypothetical protein